MLQTDKTSPKKSTTLRVWKMFHFTVSFITCLLAEDSEFVTSLKRLQVTPVDSLFWLTTIQLILAYSC